MSQPYPLHARAGERADQGVRTGRTQKPCIEFIGTRTRQGYGMVSSQGQRWFAHRLAWTHAYGPIPAGLLVCHRCDNPPCIEPSHLFLGTHGDNARDRDRKGRASSAWHQPEHRQGERNPKAKLTAALVRELRLLHSVGESYRSLGRRFGLHQRTVTDAITGRTWGHV